MLSRCSELSSCRPRWSASPSRSVNPTKPVHIQKHNDHKPVDQPLVALYPPNRVRAELQSPRCASFRRSTSDREHRTPVRTFSATEGLNPRPLGRIRAGPTTAAPSVMLRGERWGGTVASPCMAVNRLHEEFLAKTNERIEHQIVWKMVRGPTRRVKLENDPTGSDQGQSRARSRSQGAQRPYTRSPGFTARTTLMAR
jgi:hypothetical protein